MHRLIIMLAAAAAASTPAQAQSKPALPPVAALVPPPPAPAVRIAELESLLARQTAIADNATQELDKLRAELALKDELLVLGRDRNAELYAVAKEIVDKVVRPRSLEPFVQAGRVRMENLKQSYEDRLYAARIYPGTLPPSVQRRMDAELKAASATESGAAAAAAPAPQN